MDIKERLRSQYERMEEFPYTLDDGTTHTFSVQRLSPGHVAIVRNTAIIKSYRKRDAALKKEPTDTEDTTPNLMVENREKSRLDACDDRRLLAARPRKQRPKFSPQRKSWNCWIVISRSPSPILR